MEMYMSDSIWTPCVCIVNAEMPRNVAPNVGRMEDVLETNSTRDTKHFSTNNTRVFGGAQ